MRTEHCVEEAKYIFRDIFAEERCFCYMRKLYSQSAIFKCLVAYSSFIDKQVKSRNSTKNKNSQIQIKRKCLVYLQVTFACLILIIVLAINVEFSFNEKFLLNKTL